MTTMTATLERLWGQCKARESDVDIIGRDERGRLTVNGRVHYAEEDWTPAVGMETAKARRRWRRRNLPNTQRRDAACGLCGARIGPDITGRPMCYGCGPKDMRP